MIQIDIKMPKFGQLIFIYSTAAACKLDFHSRAVVGYWVMSIVKYLTFVRMFSNWSRLRLDCLAMNKKAVDFLEIYVNYLQVDKA